MMTIDIAADFETLCCRLKKAYVPFFLGSAKVNCRIQKIFSESYRDLF